jgi:hypothetical protein
MQRRIVTMALARSIEVVIVDLHLAADEER